jgi:CheY-like chemotaxis protein
MMPVMDGIETTKHLREAGYTKPIVALTANAVVGQANVFLQNGFDEFISKPIDIRQLNSVLNRQIRDKQTPETIEDARRQKSLPFEVISTEPNDRGQASLPVTPDRTRDAMTADKNEIKLRLISKHIDGLDIISGIQRYNGDEDTYIRILRSYTASVRKMLNAIEAFNVNNLSDYKIMIHGIKGASFDIFAEKIGQKAEILEDAADNGDLRFIDKKNPGFLEFARHFIGCIEELLISIEAGNQKQKREKPDERLLKSLMYACQEHRMDKVDETMAEIEKFNYEKDEGLTAWLRENVDLVNYTTIAKKLSEM